MSRSRSIEFVLVKVNIQFVLSGVKTLFVLNSFPFVGDGSKTPNTSSLPSVSSIHVYSRLIVREWNKACATNCARVRARL